MLEEPYLSQSKERLEKRMHRRFLREAPKDWKNVTKHKALKEKTGSKEQHFDSYYKSGKGDLGVIKKHFKEYKKYSQERASKEN